MYSCKKGRLYRLFLVNMFDWKVAYRRNITPKLDGDCHAHVDKIELASSQASNMMESLAATNIWWKWSTVCFCGGHGLQCYLWYLNLSLSMSYPMVSLLEMPLKTPQWWTLNNWRSLFSESEFFFERFISSQGYQRHPIRRNNTILLLVICRENNQWNDVAYIQAIIILYHPSTFHLSLV